MGRTVLIDTGPIVAALRKRDEHHEWARAHFEAATEPFVTCEAVVSECMFLLEGVGDGKEALCGLLDRGIIVVGFALEAEMKETLRLIRRYRDTPMSFADACLVRMAEMNSGSTVFTTDSDFRIYRKHSRQVIPAFMPD
jgi:predicted nucleic acid-binding protein